MPSKCFATFFLTLVILFRGTLAASGQDEFAGRLHLAEQETQQGNYDAAMVDVQAALAIDQLSPEAWYQMGLLLSEMTNFRDAETAFRHALELKPDFAEAHYGLGLTLIANPQSKMDWPAAMSEFQEALKDKPDYAEAHNLLGAGLAEDGEADKAILEFRKAIQLKPSLADAHFNLAIALEGNDRFEEAITEYQAAVAAKGTYPKATVSLAKLYFRLGKLSAAKQQLMEALKLDPDLADAHHALADVSRSLHESEDAKTEMQITQVLDQRRSDAIESSQLSNLGLSTAASGNMAGANETLRKAVVLKPDYGIPHFNLGLILADQGDLVGATQEFAKAISLLPGQARPWLELGRVLSLRGEPQAALAAVSWAAHLSPSDATIAAELNSLQDSAAATNQKENSQQFVQPPDAGASSDTAQAHLTFANELSGRGDSLGAVGELLRSLSLSPSDADARRELAQDYIKLGDVSHATVEYYKLLDANPDDVDARVVLAQSLLDRGDAKSAAEEFRRALQYRPESATLRADLARALRAAKD